MISNSSTTILPMHTSCRGCIFAKYENNKQIDCDLNRINLYKAAGAEVVPVYDKDGNNFFVINNRLCMFKRNDFWGDQHPVADWQSLVTIENKMPLASIVFDLGSESDYENLKKTLDHISQGYIIPNFVMVVTKINSQKIFDILDMKKDYPFKIKVQSLLEDISRRQILDICVESTKSEKYLYYIAYDTNCNHETDYTKVLFDAVFYQMKQIGVVRPTNEQTLEGAMYHRLYHKKFSGHSFKNLEDKIIEDNYENSKEMVVCLSDIYVNKKDC